MNIKKKTNTSMIIMKMIKVVVGMTITIIM